MVNQMSTGFCQLVQMVHYWASDKENGSLFRSGGTVLLLCTWLWSWLVKYASTHLSVHIIYKLYGYSGNCVTQGYFTKSSSRSKQGNFLDFLCS